MRVLITGGAGFIGSHLADAYLERGDEVFILDDLSTGSIDNIRHLRAHPRFHYTIESVHHAPTVAELVRPEVLDAPAAGGPDDPLVLPLGITLRWYGLGDDADADRALTRVFCAGPARRAARAVRPRQEPARPSHDRRPLSSVRHDRRPARRGGALLGAAAALLKDLIHTHIFSA